MNQHDAQKIFHLTNHSYKRKDSDFLIFELPIGLHQSEVFTVCMHRPFRISWGGNKLASYACD